MARTSLVSLGILVEKHGYAGAADILGVTYSYVHQVLAGKLPMGVGLREKILDLNPKPPRVYPPTVTVRWSGSEADRQLVLDTLANEDRERVMTEEAHRKAREG